MNTIKLKVGCFYRNRKGDVVGPMEENKNPAFPFVDQEAFSYTKDGYYGNVGYESELDLIEEVPAPGSAPQESKPYIATRRDEFAKAAMAAILSPSVPPGYKHFAEYHRSKALQAVWAADALIKALDAEVE